MKINLVGIIYESIVSSWLADNQAVVWKLSDARFRIISGRTLDTAEMLNVIRQYWEREFGRRK